MQEIFWIRDQKAFDVRVFDPSASRYLNQNLRQCYQRNEREKKNAYNERILNIEHGSFTPLVFTIQGGMSRECHMFYKRLSELISIKRNEPLALMTNWVRTKISFALLRSCLLYLRGSRTPWSHHATEILDSVSVSSKVAMV